MLTFKKALPEETGIPSGSMIQFIKRLETHQIPMHSLLLLHHDKLIFEGYYAPLKAESLHRMFSISKSFTAVGIGLLAEEGKLCLDDRIASYFPEKLPEKVHPWVASMTIRDMLMMRSCHAATTYKANPGKDWVESFFSTPPTHPAGRIFHYDTSSAHTLCALVEKLSGMSLLDYIKKKLDILGFSESSYMLKDPFGVSMGGSGLVATSLDLMKFGYFIAHRGYVCHRQLLSPSFIEMAISCLSANSVTAPIPEEAHGYGMQFWRNGKNGFTCYGMGGQLIIVLPEYDLICVTTADTQGIGGGNQQIYDALYEEILPNIGQKTFLCPKNAQKLNETISTLKIKPLTSYLAPEAACHINGQTFYVQNENTKFASLTLHLKKIPDSQTSIGNLSFIYSKKEYSFTFGIGFMETGFFPIYNLYYAASGAWLTDGTLHIKVHIIDSYVGSIHFQFSFGHNDLVLFMRKQEESLFQEFTGHLYCTI